MYTYIVPYTHIDAYIGLQKYLLWNWLC